MSQPYYYNPPGFEPQNNFQNGQNGQDFQLNIKLENEKKQLKKYGNIMGMLITLYFADRYIFSDCCIKRTLQYLQHFGSVSVFF